MIKTEKELTLLQLLSQLHLTKIDEPKSIYIAEVSEFAKELEQNLYSLEESKQKIYLNRVREKFFDWIDGNTVKRVSPKPKTKQEKNLRALVNTANYTIGVIETNIARFISGVNSDFEDSKESFNNTYNNYKLSEAKGKYLLAQIKKTEKYIASVESEPEWQQFEHNQKYFEGGILFLKYLREIEIRDFPKGETEKLKEVQSDTEQRVNIEKIKWLGSPEQFGFMFGELVGKGYIELPTKETEGRFSKLAELCLQYFEILATKGKTKGKQTTKGNLERAINPETNSLNIKGKGTLKLPPLKDLK